MAIMHNGKAADSIYHNGKKVGAIYQGGKLVYQGRYIQRFTGRIWEGALPGVQLPKPPYSKEVSVFNQERTKGFQLGFKYSNIPAIRDWHAVTVHYFKASNRAYSVRANLLSRYKFSPSYYTVRGIIPVLKAYEGEEVKFEMEHPDPDPLLKTLTLNVIVPTITEAMEKGEAPIILRDKRYPDTIYMEFELGYPSIYLTDIGILPTPSTKKYTIDIEVDEGHVISFSIGDKFTASNLYSLYDILGILKALDREFTFTIKGE